MEKKRVTLRDIAEQAGLSTASVSMILAGKSLKRFSPETVDTVYNIARTLGYETKRNKEAGKVIVLVCPSVINPYYATIIQGMEQEAKACGLRTLLMTTYWDIDEEKWICEFAKDPLVAGVVFAMIPQQPDLVRELNKAIPVVAVGDKQNELGIDTVDVNNFNAGLLVGRHLIELGHRNIAYITTSLNSQHSARVRRFEGLKEALKHAPDSKRLCLFTEEISALTELHTVDIEHRTGYKLAKKCLSEKPQVTAIVAINDMVAYGVIDAIKDAGHRIPEDYSVCGFDNIYPSHFSGVGLTTVEHSIIQRGKSAVRLIKNKIDHQRPLVLESDDAPVTRVEYQSRLIVRGSSGTLGKMPPHHVTL
jgi:DNA-binding LacI/PurR family transcriptional regulator